MQVAHLDLLEKANLQSDQARAILQVMDDSLKQHGESAATKSDLHQLEIRLVKWMVALLLGGAGLVLGGVYFLLTHTKT